MNTRLLALILIASGAVFGGDREFDRIVKAIESHYGTRRTHIPFMGVANLFVKAGHPGGASGFKLAVFEDLQSSPENAAEIDRLMAGAGGGRFHPLVRTHSGRSGESTYIYAGESGKTTKMLIATFEHNQATVIQVNVSSETLLKSIRDPEGTSKSFREAADSNDN